MAAFKFKGDPHAYGQDVLKIRCRLSDGTVETFNPPDGVKWNIDDIITTEEAREIRHLRIDPRFTEVF